MFYTRCLNCEHRYYDHVHRLLYRLSQEKGHLGLIDDGFFAQCKRSGWMRRKDAV